MTISFSTKGGGLDRSKKRLEKMRKADIMSVLNANGQKGVNALSSATPYDSGETAMGWYYEVKKVSGGYSITWKNRHSVDGSNIAILLQYGHGTGTGGYVAGRDYINPAIKPIFDQIATNVWKAVTS